MHIRVPAAALLLVALAFSLLSCSRTPPLPRQKMVILGFDGMDPRLVQQWVDEGKLPNIKALMAEGGLYPLTTTHSAESPTAWASFATGANPGKHNIYDFLVRDTETYLPDLGMVRREPARFLFDWIPIARPKVHSTRGGESFWVTAGQHGVRSSILTVPVTFPPEEVANGELLSGLPLPDIRGTMGTFYYFATDLSRFEEGGTEMGGILKRLVMENDVADTSLTGPPDPIVRSRIQALRQRGASLTEAERTALAALQQRRDVELPMRIRWNRPARTAIVELGGRSVPLDPGRWSAWIPLEFRINLFTRVHGMTQLLLLEAGDELRLYVSPVNWTPDNPPVPISSPSGFAERLARSLGPYRTLGWAEATWPLNEERIDEATFMDDLYRAFDDRAQVIISRVAAGEWDLLVGVIESTDRVQHMMWRFMDDRHPMYDAALAAKFGDAIERIYRRADMFVGDVLERLEPGTTLLVLSDHGFHSWRKAVNLNTWLVQNGYMVLEGQQPADKTLDDLFSGGTFWENVDWTRTRAYAMGIGQIYVNLRGRESGGTVSPGAEADALLASLTAGLLTMTDPEDGSAIVRSVYKGREIYSGPYIHAAPDLQVGMHEGYRVSWQTTLGGAPEGLVNPNMRKWSGDHGGYDFSTTAGVLITNRRLERPDPSIMDIAPTVLKYFNVPIPAEIDGTPAF